MSDFEILFKQFEKHIDGRLDRIENALTILNSDNRENSKRIAEHNILIAQNKIDLDNLGALQRAGEKTCQTENSAQHKKLFEKVDKIESDMAFFKGATFIIPFGLSALYFIINYLGKK
jgi:hypothetical protein